MKRIALNCLIISLVIVFVVSSGCISSDGPQTTGPPLDSDSDGWTDEEEGLAGTDPFKADTDGDGIKDPVDPNPLVPQTTAPPSTTMPPTTAPPTTMAPTTAPPSTTMPPTTAPPTTMAPPDYPDLGDYVFGFENFHSSDSTCCRTGDIIDKVSAMGAQTVLYEEEVVTVEMIEDLEIDVLMFGMTTSNRLTDDDLNQLYHYILNGGVVWLATVTPGYDDFLSNFGTTVGFVSKTKVNLNVFRCQDEDWISYGVDEFYVGSIFTFENLETWETSIHVYGYDGYYDWPQVIYKQVGDGYIFCSNMAFCNNEYSHLKDNITIFTNIAHTIASLL